MQLLFGLVLTYLIGSIPTAYIFGKFYKGIDIREHGSGNVGATNVFRVLGKTPGIMVLLLDILKGLIPVVFLADMLGQTSILYRIFFGIVAVCGHNWTVFLQFKGGKGIATSLGVLIGLTLRIPSIRIVLLFVVLIWLCCFLLTGYVSLASVLAATLLPIIMVVTDQPFELKCLGFVFCVFIILRHRVNVKRLLAGQESRVKLFSSKNK
ncbi:MAG: glycerol-3-phosphate 1-O-acyltransferase PlsY [Candidatus Omnitrophica bacterium]|nr:glycerol-3-phosphate 1-O-acyltransferase PlsY [Candidatus Omnitrophota bacterium]